MFPSKRDLRRQLSRRSIRGYERTITDFAGQQVSNELHYAPARKAVAAAANGYYDVESWTIENIGLVAQRQSSGLIIHQPKTPNHKQNKPLTKTPKTDLASYLAEIAQKHPDLAETAKVWPDLPEHIKAAIKALIHAHIKEQK